MMNRVLLGLIGGVFALSGGLASAAEQWQVAYGKSQFAANAFELEVAGVSTTIAGDVSTLTSDVVAELPIVESGLVIDIEDRMVVGYKGAINHGFDLIFSTDTAAVRLEGLSISIESDENGSSIVVYGDAQNAKNVFLTAVDSKIGFDYPGQMLLVEIGQLAITEALAARLGQLELAGISVGTAMVQANVVWVGGESPEEDAEGSVAGGNQGTECPNPVGPDVIVGNLSDIGNFNPVGDIDAFAVGTDSCNIGNQNIQWIAGNNQHPVIGQSMYRLKNGRFEHIGQSWLKHGFTALTLNICGCGCSGQGGAVLGVGCSDPYGAGLNGSQPGLGPKSEVNANTGLFTYPHDSSSGNSIYKRVQVRVSDLDPNQNGGGTYFVEGQYVALDDAQAGNQDNNASYRRVTITGSGNNWNAQMADTTQREKPAIRAWKANDPTVVETDVRVPNEGLMILAAKATELNNGLWHYEYALQNLNSDRSAGWFMVPVPQSAIVENMGFHDVDYHSGEPYMLDDWTQTVAGGEMKWAAVPYTTNPNSNALRWGTLYNFRFDCNLAPVEGEITIGMFKPGTPSSIQVLTTIPDPTGGDCNFNILPDYCDVNCNGGKNGECNVPGCGLSDDCNGNGAPDECETNHDCNSNSFPDDCDIATGSSDDCDNNENPDECDPDLDGDTSPDGCDDDIDGDGLLNGADLCDFTPPGVPIRPSGAQIGDVNSDCELNLDDFDHLVTCMLGSGPNDPASPGCQGIYDIDVDTFIDLKEIAYFQIYSVAQSE